MLNISDKVDNTPGASGELTADEYNDHKNELQNAVTQTGQTLTNVKDTQNGRAMYIYATSAQTMDDGAPSADIIQLTPPTGSSGLQVFDAYSQADGCILEFNKILANTSSTVVVNVGQTAGTLLGAKDLKLPDGTDPLPGQAIGQLRIQFSVSNDYWTLLTTDTIATGKTNDFINGAMDISQRGTIFTSVSDGDYTLDRMRWSQVGSGVVDITQDSATPSNEFNHSLKVDVTTTDGTIAATDIYTIDHIIEGYNFKKYHNSNGKYGTIGFWIRSTKTGTMGISVRNDGGGTSDRSYVTEITINSADTYEYKTIPILFDEQGGTWDYTNGRGLIISFCLAAGTNFQTTAGAWQTGNYVTTSNQTNYLDNIANDVYVTGCTFNEGISSISFDYYDIQREESRCERYTELIDGGEAFSRFGQGQAGAGTDNTIIINYKTKKRSTAYSLVTNGSLSLTDGSSTYTISSISLSRTSRGLCLLTVDTTTGPTAGTSVQLRAQSDASAYLLIDNEL